MTASVAPPKNKNIFLFFAAKKLQRENINACCSLIYSISPAESLLMDVCFIWPQVRAATKGCVASVSPCSWRTLPWLRKSLKDFPLSLVFSQISCPSFQRVLIWAHCAVSDWTGEFAACFARVRRRGRASGKVAVKSRLGQSWSKSWECRSSLLSEPSKWILHWPSVSTRPQSPSDMVNVHNCYCVLSVFFSCHSLY